MLKAIETRYKGYRFRSRLEARWAVFFDALGIRWEYEKEGFEFGEYRYLPDFFLPEMFIGSLWLEIKPTVDLANVDREMHEAFCRNLPRGQNFLVAIGLPMEQLCFAYSRTNGNRCEMFLDVERCVPGRFSQPELTGHYFNSYFADMKYVSMSSSYKQAAIEAQFARFEHGEQPRIGSRS